MFSIGRTSLYGSYTWRKAFAPHVVATSAMSVLGGLRQEDSEFEAILGCKPRSCWGAGWGERPFLDAGEIVTNSSSPGAASVLGMLGILTDLIFTAT